MPKTEKQLNEMIPSTEDLLEELRATLDDEELTEEKMMNFMNVFEALDNALTDGEAFPEDWLEQRMIGSN